MLMLVYLQCQCHCISLMVSGHTHGQAWLVCTIAGNVLWASHAGTMPSFSACVHHKQWSWMIPTCCHYHHFHVYSFSDFIWNSSIDNQNVHVKASTNYIYWSHFAGFSLHCAWEKTSKLAFIDSFHCNIRLCLYNCVYCRCTQR